MSNASQLAHNFTGSRGAVVCSLVVYEKKSRINSTDTAVGGIGVAQMLKFQLFDRVEMLLEMILLSQYAWWP